MLRQQARSSAAAAADLHNARLICLRTHAANAFFVCGEAQT
jgi:hypothetical protein